MRPGAALPGRRVWAAALLFSVIAAATAQQRETALTRIQARGVLRVGMLSAPQFPYFFQNGGSASGLDADLAAELAGLLDVRLAIDATFKSRQEMVKALTDGRIDIAMSKYKPNLADAARVRFSNPYSYVPSTLLVNRGIAASYRAAGGPVEVFRGREAVIGTLDDAGHARGLTAAFPLAAAVVYPSVGSLCDALLAGACAAAFLDAAESGQLLGDRPELGIQLQYVELPSTTEAVAAAVCWRDEDLAGWLNVVIASRGRPAGLAELFKTYGSEVSHGD